MTVLALQGVRGGVGTTSLVAALGFALQLMGKRVLLLDLCPRNLLCLHCNVALTETDGWARRDLDGSGSWDEALLNVQGGLYLLPYGRLEAAERGAQQASPVPWSARLSSLERHFDWLLIDLPAAVPGAHQVLGETTQHLRVLEADAACHALLSQEEGGETPLLVNRFDPLSQLQRDLLLLWRERLDERLVPQVIHRDEAMAAALAWKSPLGYYGADSLAAQDIRNLAIWCQARWGDSHVAG